MNIELTDKEFRRLLDLVYIGNWILNSTREKDRFEDYDILQEKLFALCARNGMSALISRWQGHIFPSQAYENGGIHEAIADYEDAVFFDILAEELARRDLGCLDGEPADLTELNARMDEYMDEFEKEGRNLLELCHRYHVPLIINDNVALAARINADGVHIGQSDMELENARKMLGADKIIGVTAKTVEQAKKAEAAGADYLGSGAVFGSSTKTDAKPMEFSLFCEICESVQIPVVAIGGINADNVPALKGSRLAGVAVVSGIFACRDIEAGTRALLAKVETIL